MSTFRQILGFVYTALFITLLCIFGMTSLGFQPTVNTFFKVGKMVVYFFVVAFIFLLLIQFVAIIPTPLVEEKVVVDDEESVLIECVVQRQEEEEEEEEEEEGEGEEGEEGEETTRILEWLESEDDEDFPDILGEDIVNLINQTMESLASEMMAIDTDVEMVDAPPLELEEEGATECRVFHVWELNKKTFKNLCNPSLIGQDITYDVKGTGPRPPETGVLARPASKHTGIVGPVAIPKPSAEVVKMMEKIRKMREQSES